MIAVVFSKTHKSTQVISLEQLLVLSHTIDIKLKRMAPKDMRGPSGKLYMHKVDSSAIICMTGKMKMENLASDEIGTWLSDEKDKPTNFARRSWNQNIVQTSTT